MIVKHEVVELVAVVVLLLDLPSKIIPPAERRSTTARDTNRRVTPGDADTNTDGFQVAFDVGRTTVKVKVTDGRLCTRDDPFGTAGGSKL